ncbi:unnamed protein product [Cunninghamella echinulata]
MSTSSSINATNKPVVKSSFGNAILVNPSQHKNPILRSIHNVRYEFNDSIKCDYAVGATTGVLYLSLRYHRLYPNYIYDRMAALKRMYVLKILLVYVDTEDHQTALRELNLSAISHQFTLMLSWSLEETARYLETYKAFETKPDDLIREKVNNGPVNIYTQMTDTLTNIRGINKTDVLTLMSNFGSFHGISTATSEQLSLCPGLGELKVKRLQQAFTQPFIIREQQQS